MQDGSIWHAEGHGTSGGAGWIGKEGYIEFTKIKDATA